MTQTLDAVLAKGQTMPEKNRFPAVLQPSLYESHPQDCRVTGPVEQCPTVSAKWGTGGNNTPLVTDNSLGFQSKASFCTGIESGISVPITTESKPAVVYPDAVVQPGEALPLAYDDRNQAVSTDTHHTPLVTDGAVVARESGQGYWMEDNVSDTMRSDSNRNGKEGTVVVQSGDASAFSWQCRGDMRGMVPRPTAQLQRCQIKAVMVPEVAHTLRGASFDAGEDGTGRGTPIIPVLDAVQVQWASGGGQVENPTAQALRSNAEHNYQFVRQTMHVRRLTPVECERLQGFPDGWTDIRPNGKDTPDSPRYKALGNSMAVPVMRWIGMRIAEHNHADANHFVDGNKLVVVARKESSRG